MVISEKEALAINNMNSTSQKVKLGNLIRDLQLSTNGCVVDGEVTESLLADEIIEMAVINPQESFEPTGSNVKELLSSLKKLVSILELAGVLIPVKEEKEVETTEDIKQETSTEKVDE